MLGPVAVLPVIVEFWMVAGGTLWIPPPAFVWLAVLPATRVLRIVSDPPLPRIPPPSIAALAITALSATMSSPALRIPPPDAPELPLVIVRPEIVALAGSSTKKIR